MEWIEVNPLPEECIGCTEEDCYNCDFAGKRWVLSREDELRTTRMMLVKSIERTQRKIDALDAELEELRKEKESAQAST